MEKHIGINIMLSPVKIEKEVIQNQSPCVYSTHTKSNNSKAPNWINTVNGNLYLLMNFGVVVKVAAKIKEAKTIKNQSSVLLTHILTIKQVNNATP